MKTRKSKLLLFGIVLLLAACSKNSENDNIEPENLIVGEWLFISENDYRCGTNEVVNERLGTDNDSDWVDVYVEDGTWYSLVNGERVTNGTGEGGTWANIGDNSYEIFYVSDNVTQTTLIEFEGNNVMKFGIEEECFMQGDQSLYTYSVYNRK